MKYWLFTGKSADENKLSNEGGYNILWQAKAAHNWRTPYARIVRNVKRPKDASDGKILQVWQNARWSIVNKDD